MAVKLKRTASAGSLATAPCEGALREPANERPLYRLELRPEPGCSNPTYALRQLLKRALRDYGLRCISAVRVR